MAGFYAAVLKYGHSSIHTHDTPHTNAFTLINMTLWRDRERRKYKIERVLWKRYKKVCLQSTVLYIENIGLNMEVDLQSLFGLHVT
jgi:hypothetical protein